MRSPETESIARTRRAGHNGEATRLAALPTLGELGTDLLHIGGLRRFCGLAAPFFFAVLYAVLAEFDLWLSAILALVCLTFCTFGSISHDLVHSNLGLSKRMTDVLLAAIELLALRSGHAYRAAHLHHHARFPHDDDVEAAAAHMTPLRALAEGVVFHPRVVAWSWLHARRDRAWIIAEVAAICAIVAVACWCAAYTLVPLVYVAVLYAGSWVFPFATAYIPHNPAGRDALEQTRAFRGVVASVVALAHLYHLEHHLYPRVPHQNWPALARRLDPHFAALGVTPIRLGF